MISENENKGSYLQCVEQGFNGNLKVTFKNESQSKAVVKSRFDPVNYLLKSLL